MNELIDATSFSKFYPIILKRAVTKKNLGEMLKRLIQSIGKPLAHNGVIIGHIKILAEISDEEFLFLSLTSLERVNIAASSDWTYEGDELIGLDIKISVLLFGHSKSVVVEVVKVSIAALCLMYNY